MGGQKRDIREPMSGEIVEIKMPTIRAFWEERVHVCVWGRVGERSVSGEPYFFYNPRRTLDFSVPLAEAWGGAADDICRHLEVTCSFLPNQAPCRALGGPLGAYTVMLKEVTYKNICPVELSSLESRRWT